MKRNFGEIFIFFVVFFLLFAGKSASALELYSIEPFTGIEWTFETTRGIQNILAKESSSAEQNSQAVGFKGLLFRSYIEKELFTKAQLNLGFSRIPRFLWSDAIVFFDVENEAVLNESLRCVEFDGQFLLPIRIVTSSRIFYPFMSYSFINYRFKKSRFRISTKFNTVSFGIQYNHKISKAFGQNFYLSYSPIGLSSFDFSEMLRALNYGAEVIANFNRVGFTLFLAFRRGLDKNTNIFKENTYRFSTTEIGMAFHARLF